MRESLTRQEKRPSPGEIITRTGASFFIATSGLGPTPQTPDFQPISDSTDITSSIVEFMPSSSMQIKGIVVEFPKETSKPAPENLVFRDFPNSQPKHEEKPTIDLPQPSPEVVTISPKRTVTTARRTEAPTTLQSACGYEDIPTRFASYSDWARTLVDTIYMLSQSYYPPDLVSTVSAELNSGSVRSLVISDLKDMANAANAAGVPLEVQSSFRSYATQVSTFNYWVSVSGYQAALLASARPGHSEHQMGTAVDFRAKNGNPPWNYPDWGKTPTGAWMAKNAWKFGFIMSYPPGVSPSKTCYKYEPWHFRYVGREVAAAIHNSGLSLREWLMQNYPIN